MKVTDTRNRVTTLENIRVGDVFMMDSYVMMRIEKICSYDEDTILTLCLNDGKVTPINKECEVNLVDAELVIRTGNNG